MTERTSGRDADLRARMRSQVRTPMRQVSRTAYGGSGRRMVGQDFVTRAATPAAKPQPKAEPLPIVQPQQAGQTVKHPTEPRQYGTGYVRRQSTYIRTDSQRPQPAPAKRRKKKLLHFALPQNRLLTGMAAVIFAVGIAVAVNGMMTNKHITAQVQALSAASDNSETTKDSSAPSTNKPSDTAVRSYAVAPTLPRYISIPGLNVFARVTQMGVNSKNQLQAPGNVFDAGWYTGSSQPGSAGAMLIDGHISSWTTKGVFYGINKLKAGDIIDITRGDGQKFTYAVRQVQIADQNSVDMASLLVSADQTKPGLNLISCFGDVIPGTNEFDKRVIVNAVLQ